MSGFFRDNFLRASLLLLVLIISSFQNSSGGSEVSVSPGVNDTPLAVEKVGNWTVTGMDTYRDTEIILDGNLSVSGSLILDNSDLNINGGDGFLPRISVQPGGSLVVRNGSSITGKDSRRYTFQALSGSNVLITHSEIMHCGIPNPPLHDMGLYTETNNFQVLHSQISFGANGIVANGSSFLVVGTNISMMEENGILLQNSSRLNASMLNFTQCGRSGVELTYSSMDMDIGRFEEARNSIIALGSTVNISNSALSSLSNVIMSMNSSRFRVVDSRPIMGGLGAILVREPDTFSSFARFLNSTFGNVQIFDPGARVLESTRFDIKVETNGGAPAVDADVEVRNRMGDLVFQGLTGSGGYIMNMELDNTEHNFSGTYSLNPHNLSVLYDGAMRQKDFDGTGSPMTSITVLLSDPVVRILYPKEGDWLSTGSFFLNGKVEDPRPITDIWLSLDGSPEVRVPGGNPFSVGLDLPDGPHDVRVLSMNDDGKYGSAELSFGIDTVYPDLNIQTPSDGASTNGSTVKVAGTVSLDATLFIQDVEVPADLYQGGNFIYTVVLEEGNNQIVVRAVDRAGNSVQRTLNIYRDSTPPVILVFSPLNGSRINVKDTLFRGTVDSSTLRLTINDLDVTLSMGGFEYLISGLNEGSNRIVLVAFDGTGSRTVRTITLFVDTEPPEIMVTDSPHLTNQREVRVTGLTDPGSRVMVENRIVEVYGGVFNTTVELMEGDNNITLTATDELGNYRTIHYHIILDLEAPSFESVIPASGSTVTNPILEIAGSVYDENGIRAVRGRLGSSGFVEISRKEEWTWVVTLSPGENILDIEIEDRAGNTRMGQFVYTLEKKDPQGDVDPPTIVIQSPPSNTSVHSGKVRIEGWAVDDTELVSVHVKVNDGEWTEVTGLNTWSIELELEKGIYVVYARAVDSSGNTRIESIWISVFTGSGQDNEDVDGSSRTPLFIGLAIFVLVLALFIGYMLYLRNRNLRQQLDEKRREASEDRIGRRRRPGYREARRQRPGMDHALTRDEGGSRPRTARHGPADDAFSGYGGGRKGRTGGSSGKGGPRA